ncbi:hypothetical protein GC088_09140 [Arthrobacter sp. JZ12]|uniref:hypothetical protein n=1 Tax=Arthrobacter sp. JZ12 TaxID=2654190 RepID=UPI002B472850|nr:hypothetical protein [Arthrobacter sp. JZ12]WRH25207.1 hypothetical protein GC088_09140 [Arthrobacter sp. JZ12]
MRRQLRSRLLGAVVLVVAAAGVTGCDDFVIGDRPPASSSPSPSSAPASPSPSTTPEALPMLPERAAPGGGWTVFTDDQRLISFEVREEWTVDPIEDLGEGFEEGGLHFSVSNADGAILAQLHTRIAEPSDECKPESASPYLVLASEPVDLPSTAAAEGSIEPRFVVRVIQGFRFFSSFGVTDRVGGADGAACTLYNTVQGPEHIGLYSFGDSVGLRALEPSQVSSRTPSFATIAEAQGRFNRDDFDSIRRMVMSLQVAG